jgi:septum formation protein
MKIILASTSPRRAGILRDAGVVFEICATQVDESTLLGETPQTMVARLAEAKARAAATQLETSEVEAIVIGADTAVELDGQIFGKPENSTHACEILKELSGRAHHVLTGIFLLRLPDRAARLAVESSTVTFAPLGQKEIDAYAATGEPLGKAGGYAIQGIAGRFIPRIEGCYFNVVGLPLARLCGLLLELGWRNGQ